MLSHKYHIIVFGCSTDAAAFVAALSRFLNSPEGSSYKAYQSPLEVWGRAFARADTVEIYLSDAALEAPQTRAAAPHVAASTGLDTSRCQALDTIPASPA